MINSINFQKSNGLVPVIIQDGMTREVLMLGYMNKEALERTLEKDFVYFWSRSKGKLWRKGEGSGNTLKVKEILIDCDKDTLLIKVELIGSAVCHTGARNCFYKLL